MQTEYSSSIEYIFKGIPLQRKTLDGELRKLSPKLSGRLQSILGEISSCEDFGRLDVLVETYRCTVATIAKPNVDLGVLMAALKRYTFFGKACTTYKSLPENIQIKVFGYQEAQQNA